MKSEMDARTLARLAVRYADHGVVGFGLSNDERRGKARDFDRAFAIARRAGLLAAPHGGELAGPDSVRDCLDDLGAERIGHGVRSAEDPWLLQRLADRQVTCEVCPSSNVSLGVYEKADAVPVRRLFDAGVPLALGADDPLLFGSRLAAQYQLVRDEHGFTDAELAELARQSVRGSRAPDGVRKELLSEIDAWLTGPLT
jgi:adenosine deaminase